VVQRDILAQIVELKERLGFSILFITHDLSCCSSWPTGSR
jgi:peptide/nickel transport system ATP-binding protein